MDDLRVCLVQADLVWEDKTKNLELLYAMLSTVAVADVIVLPEMFATGFTMNAAACASTPTGPEVQWMQTLAAEKKACVVGSLIIVEDEKFYNRLFWVTQLAVVGMMIDFPAQGYAFVSILFSTLHIFCSYYFCYLIWKDAKPAT